MSDYKQQVIDFFDRRTNYDAEGDAHPNEAKRLLKYVSLKSGQKILDLATGTGLVAIDAALQVVPKGSVVGVDISAGMLAQAKVKIRQQGIDNIELILADVEAIEFELEQFDVIFCCSALVYIKDILALAQKCYSWLKPSGCFAFTTPYRTAYLAEVRVKLCRDLFGIELPHIIRPLCTEEKCRSLLQQTDFEQIEIEKHLYNRSQIGNYDSVRIEREFYPRGNPLSYLSEAQLELLQAEYQKAVKQLISEKGIWQKSYHLYVKTFK